MYSYSVIHIIPYSCIFSTYSTIFDRCLYHLQCSFVFCSYQGPPRLRGICTFVIIGPAPPINTKGCESGRYNKVGAS